MIYNLKKFENLKKEVKELKILVEKLTNEVFL